MAKVTVYEFICFGVQLGVCAEGLTPLCVKMVQQHFRVAVDKFQQVTAVETRKPLCRNQMSCQYLL